MCSDGFGGVTQPSLWSGFRPNTKLRNKNTNWRQLKTIKQKKGKASKELNRMRRTEGGLSLYLLFADLQSVLRVSRAG